MKRHLESGSVNRGSNAGVPGTGKREAGGSDAGGPGGGASEADGPEADGPGARALYACQPQTIPHPWAAPQPQTAPEPRNPPRSAHADPRCETLQSSPRNSLRKRKRWELLLVVHALALLLAVAAPPPAHARRLPGGQVAAHLVSVALREWRDWGETIVDATDGTARLEHEGASELDTAPFDARARVHRYWALGLGTADHPGAAPRPNAPWSAAFISFLMQQIGVVAPSFVGNAAHARYLRALLAREREGGDEAQFELLPADETPTKPGDLLCGPRNVSRLRDRITLLRMDTADDLQNLTSAHCDVVAGMDRRARIARVIGGNVFDSVAMTRLPLTADGRLIRTLARPGFLLVRAR